MFCFVSIIGTACIVRGAGSMKRYGVSLSVCPVRPPQQRAAGLLLWARWVGDLDQLQHGAQQQMRVVPRFERVYNT